MAYSPQEGERSVPRGFPVLGRARNREKEPVQGLFFLMGFTPLFEGLQREKWGYTPIPVISPTIC